VAGFFYNLGRRVGPKVRRTRWVWQSVFGNEADLIAAEADVGRDLAAEALRHLALDPDPQAEDFVREIGTRLVARLANKQRRFTFRVLEGGEPNAFALPGGYVFVTRSIMELCGRQRDEVAFILAHEMAHVVRQHAIERVVTDSAINIASRAKVLPGAVGAWVRRVGVGFLEGAYSQDRESEADEFAVRLTRAAGFDPAAGVRLFLRLADRAPDPRGLGQYFATHPPFASRITYLKNLIATTT